MRSGVTWAMIPPKTVVVAAMRWLDLLRHSSIDQAAAILASAPQYADLSMLNYQEAFSWLEANSVNLISNPERDPKRAVIDALIVASAGLLDEMTPDEVPDVGYLPAPLIEASVWLQAPVEEVWSRARTRMGKIDLERRAKIGRLGEFALANHLRQAGWEVYHGSLDSDGLGWDIETRSSRAVVHVEVKTTTSAARAKVFLSRHELETALIDPSWILALVHIDESGNLLRFATTTVEVLSDRVPVDRHMGARWESCSLNLSSSDLAQGFPQGLPALDPVVDLTSPNPLWWPS
jgi:hypothetical protein